MRYQRCESIPAEFRKVPGYQSEIICDCATSTPIFAALTCHTCRIQTDGAIYEDIRPCTHSRYDERSPILFHIDIPYETYETQLSSDSPLYLPWQTQPFSELPIPLQAIHYNDRLQYADDVQLLPCLYNTRSEVRHLRLVDLDHATALLIRNSWHITTRAKSSYNYERRHNHCHSEYTAGVREQLGAYLFSHAVSLKSRYGVDYWVLPYPHSPA